MNPELSPISDVPACSATAFPDVANKQNATGVGNKAIVSHPVLAKYTFLHQQTQNWCY